MDVIRAHLGTIWLPGLLYQNVSLNSETLKNASIPLEIVRLNNQAAIVV